MISQKSPSEIASMFEGGQKLGRILDSLVEMSKPGITLSSIEDEAQKQIKAAGGTASFMTVGDYKWATCLCINDEVVHGIPTDRKLKSGDLFTIDIGMIYQGFHTDTAFSLIIDDRSGKINPDILDFLAVGKDTLEKAIQEAKIGNRVGDISRVIQQNIEGNGYSIIKQLVGHGVGRTLHEDPQIPGFLRNEITNTPELIEGMTIAIEIIYAKGNGTVVYANDDGWTISTRDGSISAVFEHSLAITQAGPKVLTRRPSEML
jgi:methionyl aminopeptidase